MNCNAVHELLQQSLDGTPIESPEWLAHLHQCPDCRTLASAGRRLQDGLRLLAAPQPPTDLAERIVQRVLRDRHRTRRQTRRRWAVGLALAAGVLFALTLRFHDLVLSPSEGAPNATESAPTEPLARNTSDPTQRSAPTLRESAAELSEVFAELSNVTAEETVGPTRRWVSSAVQRAELPIPMGMRPDSAKAAQNAELLQAASEGVTDGLEPVTTSARRAVDLFLRELPMDTKTKID